MIAGDLTAFAPDHRALDGISQLSDVTWPVVRGELGLGVARDADSGAAHVVKKGLGHRQNVIAK